MKKAALVVVLVAAAIAAGLWWYLEPAGSDRPPAGVELVPEYLSSDDPDRLFCAESPDTGVCRCITAGGERPDIPESECRRRARE